MKTGKEGKKVHRKKKETRKEGWKKGVKRDERKQKTWSAVCIM
jgi:hypothetical protein